MAAAASSPASSPARPEPDFPKRMRPAAARVLLTLADMPGGLGSWSRPVSFSRRSWCLTTVAASLGRENVGACHRG